MKSTEKGKANGTVAVTQWTDLYVRHNLQDTGQVPTPGNVDRSPDIIPAGPRPYSDPNQLIAETNWTKDLGGTTNAEAVNYIYLRGANLNTTQARKGQAYLYYCPASLLLWPSLWSKNVLSTSDGRPSIDIAANPQERFVSTNPFVWIPRPITGDAYSLVARLSTPENPNPIPPDGSIGDFARYISEHPDMGWRTVTTFNPSVPRFTFGMQYSQGQEGAFVYIMVRCTNCPDGSTVTLSTGTPGPNPPIYIPETTIVNAPGNSTFGVFVGSTIPANYETQLFVTWDSKGKTPLPGMQISVEAIMPVQAEAAELMKYARPLGEFGIVGSDVRTAATTGIRLGAYTAKAAPSYGGAPGSHIVREATRSSIHLVGLALVERAQSIVGTETSTTGLTLTTTLANDVEAETLTLATVPLQPGQPDADLYYDMEFSNADNAGTTQVVMTSTSVPAGAEIWFTSIDGSVPIDTAPTKIVTEPYFSVSTLVELGVDYSAKIRAYLRLNGKPLPPSWNLRFEAILIPPTEREAQMPKPVVLTNAGPKPGTLLGRVTVTN